MAEQKLWRFYNKWCNNARRTERILLRDKEILEYYSDLMKQGSRKNAILQFADYIRYLNDFILPANIEVLNWYNTVANVQEKSGIDFGLCAHLKTRVRQNMRKLCLKTREKRLSIDCGLDPGKYITISGLDSESNLCDRLDDCMFESRDNCPVRKKHLMNKERSANYGIVLANYGGILIEEGR